MVDDEEPLCLAVVRILNKYQVHVEDVGVDVSYATTHFGSGEQFFEELDKGAEFDLLLVDLKLPGMNGLDILQKLKGQGRSILAIMITAYATFETAVQATKLGAYDFLPKPFSPEELRYAVRKATDQLIISREARRLAEEQRQVRFNFISVLSHELKAPINAIEGYLKILQPDEPAGPASHDRPQPGAPGRHAQAHLRPARPHPHRIGAEAAPARDHRRARGGQERHRHGLGGGGRAGHQHHPAGGRAGGDGRRPRRARDHPQQPGVERGEVQQGRRHASRSCWSASRPPTGARPDR